MHFVAAAAVPVLYDVVLHYTAAVACLESFVFPEKDKRWVDNRLLFRLAVSDNRLLFRLAVSCLFVSYPLWLRRFVGDHVATLSCHDAEAKEYLLWELPPSQQHYLAKVGSKGLPSLPSSVHHQFTVSSPLV